MVENFKSRLTKQQYITSHSGGALPNGKRFFKIKITEFSENVTDPENCGTLLFLHPSISSFLDAKVFEESTISIRHLQTMRVCII